MQGKSDKLVLEPLNFADDHVRHCYGRKGAIFENWAWSPFFIDYKSYTMVPGVAAPQDFLKVLLECEFRVEILLSILYTEEPSFLLVIYCGMQVSRACSKCLVLSSMIQFLSFTGWLLKSASRTAITHNFTNSLNNNIKSFQNIKRNESKTNRCNKK